MRSRWTRFIDRFVPLGLLSQRRNTETVIRGLYERYKGKSLEEEFRQFGMDKKEVQELFDEVDRRYGAKMLSGSYEEMNDTMNAAAVFMAAVLLDRNR